MEEPGETETTCLGRQAGNRDISKDKGTPAIPARPASKGRKPLQPKWTRTQNEQRKWVLYTQWHMNQP